MRAIRRRKHGESKWHGGDIDELVQMFKAALTWDGNHCSKESRDHLIANGYAYRVEGQTALTGKGKLAALFCWPMPRVWFQKWRKQHWPAFNRADQKSATN